MGMRREGADATARSCRNPAESAPDFVHHPIRIEALSPTAKSSPEPVDDYSVARRRPRRVGFGAAAAAAGVSSARRRPRPIFWASSERWEA
jgi:hypothetical protein